jgi:hypothetical protein
MRFRLGLILGIGIGFALGARAGRERYDRIVRGIRSVIRSVPVQKAADLGERSTRSARSAAGGGLVNMADTIRERTAT